MKRVILAAGSGILLSALGACVTSGSVDAKQAIRRFSLPVYLYSAPSCPYAPVAEVRVIDPLNFNHVGVVEQALRLGGDAVINAQTAPELGKIPVSGTVVRFTDPACTK